MGKRGQKRVNIENIVPQENQLSGIYSVLCDNQNMKTRSGKQQMSESTNASVIPSPKKYSDAELLQDIANTASSSSIVEVEVPYELHTESSESPLSGTHLNEHTPVKHQTAAISTLAETISVTTQATPTANLKILCDAVDHDETVSSESSVVCAVTGGEPVTPTTNLKMLITAACPEIELSKSRLFTDDDEDEDDDEVLGGELSKKSSKAVASATRKQKSLGILCRR